MRDERMRDVSPNHPVLRRWRGLHRLSVQEFRWAAGRPGTHFQGLERYLSIILAGGKALHGELTAPELSG